jgi:hypothetical protein
MLVAVVEDVPFVVAATVVEIVELVSVLYRPVVITLGRLKVVFNVPVGSTRGDVMTIPGAVGMENTEEGPNIEGKVSRLPPEEWGVHQLRQTRRSDKWGALL